MKENVVDLILLEDFADRGRMQLLDRGLVGWPVNNAR